MSDTEIKELIEHIQEHLDSGIGKYEGYGLTEDECQVVIDALKSYNSKPVFYPPCEECNTKMDEVRKAYDKISWTLCSEKMPPTWGTYFVTWRHVALPNKTYVELLDYDDENGQWEEVKQAVFPYEVIAWMPLWTEPYKEDKK